MDAPSFFLPKAENSGWDNEKNTQCCRKLIFLLYLHYLNGDKVNSDIRMFIALLK